MRWYSCYGKEYGGCSKKMNMELPYESVIPLLGKHPKALEAGFQRKICISIFIRVLFKVPKRWNQDKPPPTDEWISKLW